MQPVLLCSLAAVLVTAQPVWAAALALSPDGFGALKIGMKEREAARRLGLKIVPDDGVNSYDCREEPWPAHPELVVMARNGRIARISLVAKSPIRTDRGLGLGSSEAEIRRTYGAGLRIGPHAYDDLPARYLTAWTVRGKRGVRFETDQQRRVVVIHVGDRSIELAEGCL